MKNIAGIIILYIVIFSIISCFPNGDFHSLVNITLTNQSSYNVDFYTRRIGEAEEISYTEHGRVFSGTSESFQRSSGYTYSMYCTDQAEIYTWGPQEVNIDYDQDYEWTITNFPTLEPTPEPTPVPQANIIINNNTDYEVAISIDGLDEKPISANNTEIYTKEIGNHILLANPNEIPGYWYNNIDLTEEGYIWNLESNTEFYPSENCRVWNFENNYEDHLGVDDWAGKSGCVFDSTIKKFGTYSLKDDNSNAHATIYGQATIIIGESQACGLWVRPNTLVTENTSYLVYYSWSVNDYILIAFIEVASQWTFRARVIKNGIVTDVYSDPISLDNWYYVAFSYDSNSDTIYLVVNNEIYYSFCSGLWGSSGNAYLRAYAAFYYDTQYLQRSNVDELVYTPNQFIDPQVFIDHYNNDVPWGAEYIP